MTNEKEEIINWSRMGRALFCCGVIFFLGFVLA